MSENYDFKWSDLGDIADGRPNLGVETTVLSYRLMQFTFKDVLTKKFGAQATKEIFVAAGRVAGMHLCNQMLDIKLPPEEFIAALQQVLVDLKIGVLRFEKTDLENLTFVLTVAEDLDCSGLPPFGETVCSYDEGYIAGIFETYLGRPFQAIEVDCWATGGRTCRFEVQPA
ncbi:MAG: 4-vinyl reductase [Desulfuromonas sp.]|nr:4-vinyl reductase [Desulfuromonas sp.]